MTVILNGKASNTKPEEVIAVNGKRTIEFPPVINGFVPTDITINGYARPPVLPDCVLYLPFWHSKLSRQSPIYSMDKYAHVCTVTGALWTPKGRKFDGVDDKITCGTNSALSFVSGTIILWIYHEPFVLSNHWLIDGRDGGAGVGYLFVTYQGVLAASAGTLYVDGVAGNAVSGAVWQQYAVSGIQITLATLPFLIGARYIDLTDDNWMNGTIGEVVIYNYALSAEEIKQNFDSTKWRYE